MAKNGAMASRMRGFELFRSKIEDAIDYRNNNSSKPNWMGEETANELRGRNDHNVRPTRVTKGGARIWSF